MKKPKARVSALPPLPAWARREILRLARDSGMVVNRTCDMVIKNGLEATRALLEEQIQLIASIDRGPIIESADEVKTEPAANQAQEPLEPAPMVNGTHQPENNGVGTGPDNASERRNEPGEGKPDDFLIELGTGQGGREENVNG